MKEIKKPEVYYLRPGYTSINSLLKQKRRIRVDFKSVDTIINNISVIDSQISFLISSIKNKLSH